jgi:hypothetical protein
LVYYRNRPGLRGKSRKELDEQLNYFRSHADKMQYADYVAAGLPIGSGVTEVGRKALIKARFCRSGMRWNRDSGAKALQGITDPIILFRNPSTQHKRKTSLG